MAMENTCSSRGYVGSCVCGCRHTRQLQPQTHAPTQPRELDVFVATCVAGGCVCGWWMCLWLMDVFVATFVCRVRLQPQTHAPTQPRELDVFVATCGWWICLWLCVYIHQPQTHPPAKRSHKHIHQPVYGCGYASPRTHLPATCMGVWLQPRIHIGTHRHSHTRSHICSHTHSHKHIHQPHTSPQTHPAACVAACVAVSVCAYV